MIIHIQVINPINHQVIDQFALDQSNRDDRIRSKMLIDKHLNQGNFVISHRDYDILNDFVASALYAMAQ